MTGPPPPRVECSRSRGVRRLEASVASRFTGAFHDGSSLAFHPMRVAWPHFGGREWL